MSGQEVEDNDPKVQEFLGEIWADFFAAQQPKALEDLWPWENNSL